MRLEGDPGLCHAGSFRLGQGRTYVLLEERTYCSVWSRECQDGLSILESSLCTQVWVMGLGWWSQQKPTILLIGICQGRLEKPKSQELMERGRGLILGLS